MTTAIADVDIRQYLRDGILRNLKLGHRNAVTGKVLAMRLGEKNTRHIRILIRELVKEGHAIIGDSKPPCGYYIAETAKECNDYLANLKSYLVELAYHRRDFKVASRKVTQPEQMALMLGVQGANK